MKFWSSVSCFKFYKAIVWSTKIDKMMWLLLELMYNIKLLPEGMI